MIIETYLRSQNVFSPHKNVRPVFSNSSGLKSVLEKRRFRDGLLVDHTFIRRNKAAFSNLFSVGGSVMRRQCYPSFSLATL